LRIEIGKIYSGNGKNKDSKTKHPISIEWILKQEKEGKNQLRKEVEKVIKSYCSLEDVIPKYQTSWEN